MKLLRFVIVMLLLTSCGAFIDYDYDKDVNFSEYKTYNYFTDMKTGLNQLDQNRLINAIDGKMKALGFTKSETPSFNIDIQTAEVTNQQNSNVGVGFGGTGRNTGGGISVGIPIGGNRPAREIKIEFVDDSKKGVFWEAITTQSNIGNTPQKREESFIKLIERVLSKYPPTK